jgi:hypothetical protein
MGEIVAPNHYCPLGGRTYQGVRLTPCYSTNKRLPLLAYFTTTTQVINKMSYKWKWGR